MTCPFCGAVAIVSLDGVPESYECGSGDLRQSKICRELCQLREKKAEGLTWEDIGHGVRAISFGERRFLVARITETHFDLFDSFDNKWKSFGDGDAAKAHAEELHQQAWRELRERWDRKS